MHVVGTPIVLLLKGKAFALPARTDWFEMELAPLYLMPAGGRGGNT